MRFVRWLTGALYALFIGWIAGLVELISDICERRRHRERLAEKGKKYKRCQVIPPDVYKRPDPLIYSQYYLKSLGLAVTWDNPDIQLYAIGPDPNDRTAVSSNALEKDTDYEIRATIYNGSTSAPAVGMRVDFSFLSFGIGTVSNPIGSAVVDLPVKAAPGHPAVAAQLWHTPKEKGHYCIQVKLNWADDANPNNNLGQENTNVGIAHSPALFDFEVFNGDVVSKTVTLVADAFKIPDPVDCEELVLAQERTKEGDADDQKDARAEWCVSIARRHDPAQFPVPQGWTVKIEPQTFDLLPEHTQQVHVEITPPDSFHGIQPININGFDQNQQMLGGVTLYTQR
ncbi:MAG TPA: hypothetical protein VJZ76_00695 [Thermoanaerobaculia bacterium]|nr:hypothetical protein [Thermoanaerobaculia bacterium]